MWNVQTGSVIAALDDPLASAFGAKSRSGEARPTVAGLAWATASQSVLAILLSPAVLVLWDYKSKLSQRKAELQCLSHTV